MKQGLLLQESQAICSRSLLITHEWPLVTFCCCGVGCCIGSFCGAMASGCGVPLAALEIGGGGGARGRPLTGVCGPECGKLGVARPEPGC